MAPLALLGSEILCSVPETPSPSLLKVGSTHNASVPSLFRDGITLTRAQALGLQRPGSESQHICPTNVTLSFSFLTRKKAIIISIPRLLGNDRLHVNHQAHTVTAVEGFEGFSPSRGRCACIHF